jgi:hypothetical protein
VLAGNTNGKPSAAETAQPACQSRQDVLLLVVWRAGDTAAVSIYPQKESTRVAALKRPAPKCNNRKLRVQGSHKPVIIEELSLYSRPITQPTSIPGGVVNLPGPPLPGPNTPGPEKPGGLGDLIRPAGPREAAEARGGSCATPGPAVCCCHGPSAGALKGRTSAT